MKGSGEMEKTLRVIRPGESVDDYSWAKKLTTDERLALAERLTREGWEAAHGEPFPSLDRSKVKIVRLAELGAE